MPRALNGSASSMRRIAMRTNRINIVAWVACLLILMAGGMWVIGQEEKKPAAPAAPAPGGPTAEQQAMMQAWMKLGTPGAQHEKLKMMEGKFDADVTMQMSADSPAEMSKGTSMNQSLFDGRYLHG